MPPLSQPEQSIHASAPGVLSDSVPCRRRPLCAQHGSGNPVKYRDPSGHWVETAFDVVSVGLDIAAAKQDPSFWNIAALVVDAAAVIVPVVPSGTGWLARDGKAAKVAVEIASHADEAADAARLAGHMGDGAHAVLTASPLRQVGAGSEEGVRLVKALAEQSTHGSGTRVVLGRWVEGGGYIAEAQKNGGIYYETASGVYDALGNDTLAWASNEQFLRNQLESGIGRIDFVGESIDDVLVKAVGSFRWKEIKWLEANAAKYGYELMGNSWVKVGP